jgi:hypothetical protein
VRFSLISPPKSWANWERQVTNLKVSNFLIEYANGECNLGGAKRILNTTSQHERLFYSTPGNGETQNGLHVWEEHMDKWTGILEVRKSHESPEIAEPYLSFFSQSHTLDDTLGSWGEMSSVEQIQGFDFSRPHHIGNKVVGKYRSWGWLPYIRLPF